MLKKARAQGLPWPAPSFFRSRPLACGTLAYAGGIALSPVFSYAPWLWLAAAACALAAVLLRKWPWVLWALALAGMMSLGAARGGAALKTPALPPMGTWKAEGTVAGEVTQNERGVMFWLRDVRVLSEDGEETSMEGSLYCYFATGAATKLAHGQRVMVQGNSYLPSHPRNPGGFDQAMWMAQNGAHVRLYATRAPKIIGNAGLDIRGWALAKSAGLGAYLDALYGDTSPVIRAMLLGDQRAMPDEWSQWMRDSGIAHLLAVSGLHVGIWFLLVDRLSRRLLPLSPKALFWLLALLLALYALLTGLKPSVLRASLMLLSLHGARLSRQKADPLTNLSLAALLILLARPLDLFGAGFQLSVCAVLGIVLLGPVLETAMPKRPAWLVGGLRITVAAQLGLQVPAARWFGTVSLPGVALNLIAVPLAGLLIPVAALGALLSSVWMPLGWLFVHAARGMTLSLLALSRLAAAVPLAVFRVGAFAWWTALAYFACLLLCSGAVVWRWRARGVAMVLAATLACGMGFLQGSFRTRYVQLDVGQALSGVLHTGGKTYVYDTGEENSDLTEYLLYTGSTVEGLFLSHPHSDHVGGMTKLLRSGIPVKTVYVPARADAFGAEPYYASRLEMAQAYGAEVVEISAGDVLRLGGATARVIAPDAEITRGSDPNDRSLVLLLEIGERSLLLMGDADGAAEPLGVNTDALQVAHHASANAARPAFLADATPDIALISVGKNIYGHPSADTIARLEAAGAAVYSTQQSGAITLYFMPGGIRVKEYVR